MPVHPTALVDPAARIDPTADVGPFCIVGAEVEIGARTRLMSNLVLEGPAEIGDDNVFFPFSTIGLASQDLKYKANAPSPGSVTATASANSSRFTAAPRAEDSKRSSATTAFS